MQFFFYCSNQIIIYCFVFWGYRIYMLKHRFIHIMDLVGLKTHLFMAVHSRSADTKIVAVDLQAMAPIPGVIQLQGDITKVTRPLTLAAVVQSII